MLFEKNMKDFLLMTSTRVLDGLKLSSRIYFLPSVLIYPSNICNYDCVMCDTGKSMVKDKQQMPFPLMEKILRECAGLWIKPEIHFSGIGEPLVYSRIKEVMELCRKLRLKWSMTTNGYLLDRYAEDIVRNKCYALNISIHGDAHYHNSITQVKGSYERTVKGLQKLEELKRTNKGKTPLIAVNSVISSGNVDQMEYTLQSLLALPIGSITFQHVAFYSWQLKNRESFIVLEEEKIEHVIRFMETVKKSKYPVRIHFFPKIKREDVKDYYTNLNARFRQSCILPWLNVWIYPDGDVRLCQNLFGNIKTDTLKHIINSDTALSFRERLRKKKFRIPMCFRCCHRHYY